MTIIDLLTQVRSILAAGSGMFAEPQSEEILSYCTGYSRSNLYISGKQDAPPELIERVMAIVSRRLKGEPLQYILQTAFFYDREYLVAPSVLIPRPDTETLIETILKNESVAPEWFIDIGTGSGIIVSTLSEQRPWKGIGVDISISALHIAQKNNRSGYSLLCANLFNAFKSSAQFDFIVSNPPYISYQEMSALDPEVRDFEPVRALYGGQDGLDFYRIFAQSAGGYIKSDGRIYCEIGYNQAMQCRCIFEGHGWRDIAIVKDIGNNPRVISARVPERF